MASVDEVNRSDKELPTMITFVYPEEWESSAFMSIGSVTPHDIESMMRMIRDPGGSSSHAFDWSIATFSSMIGSASLDSEKAAGVATAAVLHVLCLFHLLSLLTYINDSSPLCSSPSILFNRWTISCSSS